MTTFKPPRDNLVRAMADAFVVEPDGKTLFGRLARANEWTEINSKVEGRFIERNAPGSFKKTFAEGLGGKRPVKVLFNHGKDPQLGNQIIAEPRELGEDEEGAYYRAELLDGVPPLIVDGLRRGLYGSSHTFSVVKEDPLVYPTKPSDYNPGMLPERTIRESAVMELGPVTWPAYAGAVAGVRSLTDEYAFTTLTDDAARLRDLVGYVDPAAALSVEAGAEPHSEPERRGEPETPTEATRQENPTDMDEYISREEKVSRITELKAEQNRMAVEYPGVMPDDVDARWKASMAEQDALERDVVAWDTRQARIAANAQRDVPGAGEQAGQAPAPALFNVTRTRTDAEISDIGEIRSRSRNDEDFHQGLRDNAMRAVERAMFPHPDADQGGAKDYVAKLLDTVDQPGPKNPNRELSQRVLLTNHPIYRRTFNKYLAGQTWTPEEQRYAALTSGGTTTGGYATPWVLDPSIIATGAHTSTNPYRAACRVVPLVGTNKWEALTAGQVLTAYAGEAVAPAEGGPTFAQPTYECLKASGFITMSFEILEDRPDIASELAVLFQESKDTVEEEKFSIGAGTTVPWGLALLSEYTTLKTHGAGAVDAVDIFAMEMTVPIRHRAKGAWFGNRKAIRQVQALETVRGELFNQGYGLVGNPVQNATGNTGLQLLGKPVWEAPSMVDTFTTPDTNVLWFGDPSSYIIVDRLGLNIERVDNIFDHAAGSRPLLQRGLLAHWRNTARRVNVDAGRTLVVE